MASCQNTSKTPAIDLANFDLSVAPNADFYEYATGGWQKNNPLKPEYSRYGSFDILRDNNEKRINELFSEMTKMKAEPGSIEQKISDLYKMGLDSVRLNAEGAAPVKDAVAGILAISDRSQLTPVVARIHTAIANPFFGISVGADLMNSDINALYIGQSGLTMGDRDYYLDPENENIRTAYKEYLGKLFRLGGVPEADIEKAVAGVMNIETKLAEKSWSNTELRDIPAQYNPTAKAEFEKTYDAIDWPVYYKAMGIGDFDTIIVTTKSSIANANDLMKNAPLEDIRYYLAAQYLDDAASYLSDDFQQASFDFYGKAMAGQQEMKPRWKRAMSVPNGILSEAVGEMYVAKYFPAKDKERMLGLVKNLQTALGQHIAALDWMSDATKAKALTEKIEAYRALSKATEALSTSPSDIRSTTLVTGTVKYGGETMTTTINSEARSKTTIRNGKVLHASETKMTQDGVTSEQGTWIKDGWLYIYANAGGVTIKNKVAIDDAATAVDPEEVVTTQSGGVGLAFVKSITAAKSGSNTVYSVTVDQKAAAAISSIVSDLVDTEDEDLTSVEVSDMVLTYTLNSQGQLNNMKTSFTMKILYASGEFKGDPMTMDLNCSVDSSVLATGSAVTITFPDFSDYVLLETN